MTKTATNENYDAICAELGFDAAVQFVKIEDGRIGYTCGKPDECRLLAGRARQYGYEITPGLAHAAER